ncbi:DsbA family protein [Tomitella biformata]|uniref:DsbA family protein n=1 Tax=Tomitella biformata TaxID=630403 RepID=UPI000465A193|nr:thioredoxin domain-containing protein [Tomitella biformata]
MIIVAVLVAIAAGFGIYLAVDSGDEPESANPAVIVEESPLAAMGPLGDLAHRVDGDPLAIGAVDAPLTLVEYSDYRCPFCAKFSRDTEPELVQKYVDEGTLRIEWRDMPIFGEQSLVAARAGRAAAEQGMFWEFNTAVFAAAPASGHADLNPAALRGFAEQVGIPDLDQFDRDAASEKFDDAIWSDAAAAQAMGVVSTPSFSLNGHPMIGAQPTTLFTQVIDDLLKAQD